jgi:hypothetical protein
VINAMTRAPLPRSEFIYYGTPSMLTRGALERLAKANAAFGQRYARCLQ